MTAHPTSDAPSNPESAPDRSATPHTGPAGSDERVSTVAVDDLLGLLSDEYVCRILCALNDGPLSADDLVERCSMSRPTVYRRLDQLTNAGIVGSQLSLSAEGTQRRTYRLEHETVALRICADGVDGDILGEATHP